ncbi:MAG: ribosomal-protein-alanine N-acetyltransferase [Alphaproteobacteria bacterium]|nr:ribosomal-protein-alanine N-acetyltransferase [Alphaproteobacteria bacterium]
MTRLGGPDDAAALATIHAAAFPSPWGESAFATLLSQAGVSAILASAPTLAGFVLTRAVIDEAEILTLAVLPAVRQRGIGHALMREALRRMGATHIGRCFLEVAADNVAALALYRQLGFETTATRTGYYQSRAGVPDAIVMEKRLA